MKQLFKLIIATFFSGVVMSGVAYAGHCDHEGKNMDNEKKTAGQVWDESYYD